MKLLQSTEINNILTPELFDTVIQLFALGKSEIQVAAKLGMSKQQFKNLYESIEGLELKKKIEYGKTLHEAFYEELVQDAMIGKLGLVKEGLIKAYMQNKFNWNEKTEITDNSRSSNLTDEELQAEIEKVKPNVS